MSRPASIPVAAADCPGWHTELGTDGTRRVALSGALDRERVEAMWVRANAFVHDDPAEQWVVDVRGVSELDGAGLALLLRLQADVLARGGRFEVQGLSDAHRRLLERFDPKGYVERATPDPCCQRLPEQVGRATAQVWLDFRTQVAFIGELAAAFLEAAKRPRSVRWRDVWLAAERAGADALPIVSLIAGLVGLVLAFQSAMAMRPYGAEIYVANLVTLAMLRELGPLMTAILLAGRSGGAFAAEIGTMTVNDEVAALKTMGLRPVSFLAVPRVLGLVLMVPFLTLFANLAGILGGAVMFLTLDYPMSAYFNQVLDIAEPRHLISGLVKSVAFGVTVAGVGCLRGLQTARGPSAVGASTTRAVVAGILLIVILDAVLGTVFYFAGF